LHNVCVQPRRIDFFAEDLVIKGKFDSTAVMDTLLCQSPDFMNAALFQPLLIVVDMNECLNDQVCDGINGTTFQ
jgi:hypothetical protein